MKPKRVTAVQPTQKPPMTARLSAAPPMPMKAKTMREVRLKANESFL